MWQMIVAVLTVAGWLAGIAIGIRGVRRQTAVLNPRSGIQTMVYQPTLWHRWWTRRRQTIAKVVGLSLAAVSVITWSLSGGWQSEKLLTAIGSALLLVVPVAFAAAILTWPSDVREKLTAAGS